MTYQVSPYSAHSATEYSNSAYGFFALLVRLILKIGLKKKKQLANVSAWLRFGNAHKLRSLEIILTI